MNHLKKYYKRGFSTNTLEFISNDRIKKSLIRLGDELTKRFSGELSLALSEDEVNKLVVNIHLLAPSPNQQEQKDLNEFILKRLVTFLEKDLRNKLTVKIVYEN